jgi:hypothetical protein
MPVRLRHRIDAVQVTAIDRGETRPPPRVDGAVPVAPAAAVRAREILRFDYGAGAPGGTPSPDHPGGAVVLVGWDLDRADWRTFRADRNRRPGRTPRRRRAWPAGTPAPRTGPRRTWSASAGSWTASESWYVMIVSSPPETDW